MDNNPMSNWSSLLELWNNFYLLNKVYSTAQEWTLLSCLGAYFSGTTANMIRNDENPEQYYIDLIEYIGNVKSDGTKEKGKIYPPVVVYADGTKIDLRLHLFFLFRTSLGKGQNISTIEKLMNALNIYEKKIGRPTVPALAGSTVNDRQGNKWVKLPMIPYLLDCDALIMDECAEMLSEVKNPIYDVMPILRENTEQLYDQSNKIHNTTMTNTKVKPFYGRSTLIASSFPTEQIKKEARKGTLQRFTILTVDMTKSYTDEIYDAKLMEEKKLDLLAERPVHIETRKEKVLDEMIGIIEKAKRVIIEPKMEFFNKTNKYYYLAYTVEPDIYNKFIKSLKDRKNMLEDGLEHEVLVSFYIRGINIITKMAAIMSIINEKRTIGEDELKYAEKIFFDNLEEVKRNIGISAGEDREILVKYDSDVLKVGKELRDKGEEVKKTEFIYVRMAEYWQCSKMEAKHRVDRVEKIFGNIGWEKPEDGGNASKVLIIKQK